MNSPGSTIESNGNSADFMAEVVEPIFRVGEDENNNEVVINGRRIMAWELVPGEEELAELAGWNAFEYHRSDDVGYIELPVGTRNATSVLSATEAWTGEKEPVVGKAVEYLKGMHERFGEFPLGFSWSHVGITPDQHIFVAPPHLNVLSDIDEHSWKQKIVDELEKMIGTDEQNNDLAHLFVQQLESIK